MALLSPKWEADLYKYMSGIITNNGHKAYLINGMTDHVHVLVSMNPKQAPSDLMHDVKRSSSLWINDNRLVMGKFSWQEGFGVFSYGKSQISDIARYIERVKEHHKKHTFIKEYVAFLKLFKIEFDEKYIYKQID